MAKGRERENCVLTADFVRWFGKRGEGKAVERLCVDSKLCYVD